MQLLEQVGLAERVNHRVNQLSSGEQQRVAIARALANNPSLVLADEPTGNLDSKTGLGIIKILRALCTDSGVTIVLVTHDRSMGSLGDRMLFLRDGKFLKEEKKGTLAPERGEKPRCPSCGKEIAADFVACPYCGTKISFVQGHAVTEHTGDVSAKHGEAIEDCPGSPTMPKCEKCRELQDFGEKLYCTRFGKAIRK